MAYVGIWGRTANGGIFLQFFNKSDAILDIFGLKFLLQNILWRYSSWTLKRIG